MLADPFEVGHELAAAVDLCADEGEGKLFADGFKEAFGVAAVARLNICATICLPSREADR